MSKEKKMNLWVQNRDGFHTFGAEKKSFLGFCLTAFGQLLLETQFIIIFVKFSYNWREINRSIIASRSFFSHTENGTQNNIALRWEMRAVVEAFFQSEIIKIYARSFIR
jgi:hypothetical protein